MDQLVGRDQIRNGRSVKSGDSPDGVRCLRVSALRDGNVTLADSKPVPLTRAEAEPFLVQPGDVFVVRGNGSRALVGLAGLATEADNKTIFPDLFIKISLPPEVVPEFFVAYWNSPVVRAVLEQYARTTSGIWKINQGQIGAVEVPCITVSEQREVLAHVQAFMSCCRRLTAKQSQTLVETETLMPAILDRAFKGEL